MTVKKSLIIVITAVGILGACGETKSKEVKVDAAEAEKAATEMREEVAAKEAEIKAAKQKVADSLKKVDSLRQVKEHGHAH